MLIFNKSLNLAFFFALFSLQLQVLAQPLSETLAKSINPQNCPNVSSVVISSVSMIDGSTNDILNQLKLEIKRDLSKYSDLKLIDRDNLEELLEELALNQSGLTTAEDKPAKLLEADALMAVTVADFEEGLELFVDVSSVKDGTIIYSESYSESGESGKNVKMNDPLLDKIRENQEEQKIKREEYFKDKSSQLEIQRELQSMRQVRAVFSHSTKNKNILLLIFHFNPLYSSALQSKFPAYHTYIKTLKNNYLKKASKVELNRVKMFCENNATALNKQAVSMHYMNLLKRSFPFDKSRGNGDDTEKRKEKRFPALREKDKNR